MVDWRESGEDIFLHTLPGGNGSKYSHLGCVQANGSELLILIFGCVSTKTDIFCRSFGATVLDHMQMISFFHFLMVQKMGRPNFQLEKNTGWWFGTFSIFPYIGFLIMPID